MKSLVLAVALVSSSAMALAADSASVAGKWSVHTSVAGNDSDTVCTITQTDAIFSGSCKGEGGQGDLSGKVDGNKIVWSYESEYNGSPLTIKYAGTYDPAAKKIAGTVLVEQFGVDGEFSAEPAK